MVGLAWRMFWRDFRSGELRVLFIALAIAVAGVTSVGFFADRVRSGLVQNARELMGADLVVVSDHAFPDNYLEMARTLGLRLAETRSFPSMARAGERLQLAEITAVSPEYPLRGKLEADGRVVNAGPPVDSVWLEPRLVELLGAGIGNRISIGGRDLVFSATLTQAPDRAFNFFNLAPVAMMRLADLEATGLMGTGARVNYRLLIAGHDAQVDALRRWLEPRLGRGERIEDVENARPELRQALTQADRFLGLSNVLTLVLSAVAIALATRRHFQRHLDACAVMRCLGLTQWRLLALHVIQFLVLAALGTLLGCALGYAAHFFLIELLVSDFGYLPAPGGRPVLEGALTALVLLAGFSGPPLLRLASVPAIRVFRREFGAIQPGFAIGQLGGITLLASMAILMSRDLKLGLMAFGGLAVVAGLLILAARLLILVIAKLAAPGRWQQGLANLRRHAARVSLLVAALATGLTAILLLTVIRHEMLAQWKIAMPANAPNTFVINIQSEQRDGVLRQLHDREIPAVLSPMIRGRLMSIGDHSVSADRFLDDERARRLVEREFNLSWQAQLPEGNEIVQGQWFAPGAGRYEASVEEGIAKTLGIRLGDRLTFSIDGQARSFEVTSLRKLSWGSMRVNFFVIVPPGVVQDAPTSYITSFFLPPGERAISTRLTAQFPNLTVIDIAAALNRVRSLIERIAGAVELIFLFTMLAGAIVLESAMWASLDERRHEIAVMRALGAGQHYLRTMLLVELAAVGVLAGALAALCAMGLGALIARRIFDIGMLPDPALFVLAVLGGALFSVLSGYWSIRRILRTPPTRVLASA